jgi:hypothetical protein
MSARLNLEPKRYISWKGKTFSQITADFLVNTVNSPGPTLTPHLIMNPQPLKIYRKEIVTVPLKTCNRRTSVKISDLMETPGGNIVNSLVQDLKTNGLVNINDPIIPNLSDDDKRYALPTSGANTNIVNRCLSTQNNALNRVRSSGMIRRKFDINKNNDTYYTSSGQYLNSRNKTFTQNTYHMLRKGDDVYSSNTISHCSGSNASDALTTSYIPVYYKPSNTKFAEQGGASSSTRLLRLKYDTITDAGQKLQGTFGNATANAFAYSTTDSSLYSLKTRTGYPNIKTPVIQRYSGKLKVCDNRKFFI